MKDLDDLDEAIEIAKIDNAMRYLEKPGSQMTPAEIMSIGIKGMILDELGNALPLLRKLEEFKVPKDQKASHE